MSSSRAFWCRERISRPFCAISSLRTRRKWELWIACSRNIGIRNRRSIIFFIFRMENNFFTGEPPCPLKAADGIVLLFLLRGFFKWVFGTFVTTKYNSPISQNQVVLCQNLVQVEMRNFSQIQPASSSALMCALLYTRSNSSGDIKSQWLWIVELLFLSKWEKS